MNADTLATFWSRSGFATARSAQGATTEHAEIEATAPASGLKLAFWKVPEPKSVKDRIDLNLWTDEFEAERKRLIDLGATPVADFEVPTIR